MKKTIQGFAKDILTEMSFRYKYTFRDTAFCADNVPTDWSVCPPPLLPDEDLVRCMLYLGDEMRDRLTRLELVVHYTGGQLLYKSLGDSLVGIKVTWPDTM